MITTQQFIDKLKASGLLLRVEYSHPVLVVQLQSSLFGDDFEDNCAVVARATHLDLPDVIESASRSSVSVRFNAESVPAPIDPYNLANHWLALAQGIPLTLAPVSEDSVRAIHFYGYKGGQARSTTLALLAKRLADLGGRVLVVDADIEAPSLHLMFGSSIPRISGSLMAVCERNAEVRPVAAYRGMVDGKVDLIGCRPSGAEYDLDFLSFALETSIDPSVLRRGFSRLREMVASNHAWDIVLVDHRTGIAPSVIPTLSAWPGSTVMALRPDLLSLPALSIAKTLFSAYPSFPGAFVSFSLDPEEKRESTSPMARDIKSSFLQVLAEATETGGDDGSQIDPDVLDANFVEWYYDRAFIDEQSPDFERLSKDNQDSMADLIQVLGLDALFERKHQAGKSGVSGYSRSPSGAVDSGWFIETKDISVLMQESSAYSYIFGRKGTGKTRIYREMHSRGRGLPLLAAADYQFGGMRAQSPEVNELLESTKDDYEIFWWTLIAKAITGTTNSLVNSSEVYQLAIGRKNPVTLLIDGVETAVNSKSTKRFIEALFRVLNTVQNSPSLSEKIQFRLFVRPDLSVGIQNIEQQISGRRFDLRWEESAIFSYMLAEIERKEWFRQQFSGVCLEIEESRASIMEGRVDRADYERLLLDIFPMKIRRNNLLTMTFLRTYFSDAVSESTERRSSFYPRVVGTFLEGVEQRCRRDPLHALDDKGRITHTIIVDSFTEATEKFVSEIKQELYFALDLNDDADTNIRLVDELVASLSGLQTPFVLDSCTDKLIARMGGDVTNPRVLRDALRQMRDMGIFESHPVDPTKWRAGRLFKEALRMKYVR